MTPPRARKTLTPQAPAQTPQEPAEPTATERVDAHLAGRPVNPQKRDLAIARHAAAGNPPELDWFTRQIIDPARGVL